MLSIFSPAMDSAHVNSNDTKWGLPLPHLYRLAVKFYKEKNGKILFSYEDNLKLVAFTQQVSHGPLNSATAPPVGVLDVIGRDRRVAWQNLGHISKSQSQEGFVDLLDRLCPQFRAHVEAIKEDQVAQETKREEEERRKVAEAAKERAAQFEVDQMEEARNREECQRRELQNALNQQTFQQFKAYAEKQFPGNPEQQAVLIRQLQLEHYHQYMQQLQSQFQSPEPHHNDQMQPDGVLMDQNKIHSIPQEPSIGAVDSVNDNPATTTLESSGDDEGSDNDGNAVERANMWTRSDMKAFKAEVSAGKGDGVIRVGHGETVTVRVPTHEGGSCLFWEFATDSHDIGFGVYFEWSKPQTTEVSVHISESDDEDDDEDPGEEGDGECMY